MSERSPADGSPVDDSGSVGAPSAGHRSSFDGSESRTVLLIGKGGLADATQRALRAAGAQVIRLHEPTDGEIRESLGEEVDSVAVISGDDVVSLRQALVVENVRPGVPLVVTVYGGIVATQLQKAVRNARVMSMADIVAPTLAAPCFAEHLLSVTRTEEGFSGVRAADGHPEIVAIETPGPRPGRRLLANIGSLLRPFEPSAQILTTGLFGFFLILLVDTLAVALALKLSLVEAFYSATKTIVTVGPNPLVDQSPGWFKLFSSVAMLAALAFTAIFTAGVVDRLLDRRLTTIVGSRLVPRRDHVVVVGLGQVGLRLCLLLRDLGVPVLAIDSDPDNYNVARAKDYGLPVVIGRGGSRFLLKRLSLGRARALAAVTSHEVENISIVVAATGMGEGIRTVLHAGRGDVTNETRSLFSVGVVRDVFRIGGTVLAAAALGSEASEGFLHEQTTYLLTPDRRIEPFEAEAEVAAETAPGAEPGRSEKAAAGPQNTGASA